ncbi:PLP-dependent cysteine synthase family protein [Marinitoga lauensis]|uniref:PLP-dependent cysteine synthase family protein n=1 Tax=Marinitoga lauensis TaxID=2201189 RepID=UPI0010104C5A|nr:pyridoxal-phosphate dependent enzyme [Marinitoga lauensis]
MFKNILDLIGKTPIVRLNKIEKFFNLKNELYAKIEYFNPGGSIKDRVGVYMLKSAENENKVNKDTIIIEPTSGNTGVGIALYALSKGNKLIFTMPSKISMEKEFLLKAYGAFVVRTPTEVTPDSPNSYYKIAEILRNLVWKRNKKLEINEIKEIVDYVQKLIDQNKIDKLKKILNEKTEPNIYAYIPNQYYNKNNPKTHYETTAREIWEQFNGKIDFIFSGMGTGGTITGISSFMKEKCEIKIIGVDPVGSIYNLVKKGVKLEEALKHAHSYFVEGIGEDIIPETIDLEAIDDIVVVNDQMSFSMTRFLSKNEGILVGGSSGAALYGTIKYLKENNINNKKVLVIFPDSGRNYLTKVFNDDWLIEHGFETNDEKILEVLK